MPMDIGSWLRSLGLEEYEPAFRANAIEEAVTASHRTAEDLEGIRGRSGRAPSPAVDRYRRYRK